MSKKIKNIIKVVEKLRGSSKVDAKQRIKNLQNETIKEFEFDDSEIENIFDKIEEANPDL